MANEILKARIASELSMRRWKWKDLSDKTGLGVNTFPGWWRGKIPDTASLQKVATALGVSVSKLVGEPPAPEPPPVNLDSSPLIEIMGKVYATPFRLSMQRGLGQYIKGKPGEQGCFALQVEGDSMEPTYVAGDLIICRKEDVILNPYSDADEGATYVPYSRVSKFHNRDAIVEHEGDVMLKRLQIERKKDPLYDLWMTSLNPKYPRVKVRFGDEWKMHAVVLRTDKPPIPE